MDERRDDYDGKSCAVPVQASVPAGLDPHPPLIPCKTSEDRLVLVLRDRRVVHLER